MDTWISHGISFFDSCLIVIITIVMVVVFFAGKLQLGVLCRCCAGVYCIFCREHAVKLRQLWPSVTGPEEGFPLLHLVCPADTTKILHTVIAQKHVRICDSEIVLVTGTLEVEVTKNTKTWNLH